MNNNPKTGTCNEEKKRAIEMYDSFRDELLKRQLSNDEAYDKAILSLSSASLVLSLTFIRFIIPLEKTINIIVLKMSWGLFLLSIILIIFSYLIGNKAINKQLVIAQQYYVDEVEDAYNIQNHYKIWNERINFLSGLFFIAALICVISFIVLNLGSGELNMSKGKETFTDSASIPIMQRPNINVKKSANIPTMEKAPGSTTNSQKSSSESSSNNKNEPKNS